MPDRSRTIAIGLFQASSAPGQLRAAGISIGFGWAVYNDGSPVISCFGSFEMSPWRLIVSSGWHRSGLLVKSFSFG